MKTIRHFIFPLAVALALGGTGCSKTDNAKQQQFEQEQRDERDAAAANKAITDMNKKALGRPPPTMDLGLPRDAGTATTQSSPQQP